MVTFVNSTYAGSDMKYVVSGVRVRTGPSKEGYNAIRLQLAGTDVELDIDVSFETADSIQREINETKGIKATTNDASFDINDVSAKDLIDELYNRFNNE